MATSKKSNFLESQEGIEAKKMLQAMVADDTFITKPSYSANSKRYPDNSMPFIDKHLDFLRNNTSTDPRHYLSNLRLITRKRK